MADRGGDCFVGLCCRIEKHGEVLGANPGLFLALLAARRSEQTTMTVSQARGPRFERSQTRRQRRTCRGQACVHVQASRHRFLQALKRYVQSRPCRRVRIDTRLRVRRRRGGGKLGAEREHPQFRIMLVESQSDFAQFQHEVAPQRARTDRPPIYPRAVGRPQVGQRRAAVRQHLDRHMLARYAARLDRHLAVRATTDHRPPGTKLGSRQRQLRRVEQLDAVTQVRHLGVALGVSPA